MRKRKGILICLWDSIPYNVFFLKSLLVVVFTLNAIFIAKGQDIQEVTPKKVAEFINKVQGIYGVDDELINGYPYTPPSDLIASNPYFMYDDWNNGVIYMNGEVFENIPVKYDLTKDAMIIKATLKKDVVKLVHLNSLYVDSVMFKNHLFVHSRKFFENDKQETFFEQIYLSENPDKLGYLIHYSKQYLEQFTNIAPRGRFSDTKVKRYLLKNENLLEVNSRRSFLKTFESDNRKAIRSYMRKQNIKYNNASNKELHQLLDYSQELLID